jgi:hypothetical protein
VTSAQNALFTTLIAPAHRDAQPARLRACGLGRAEVLTGRGCEVLSWSASDARRLRGVPG